MGRPVLLIRYMVWKSKQKWRTQFRPRFQLGTSSMFWLLAVISHEKMFYRVVLRPCTYISLTDTQMFVGNFKGHTGWVPLHDRCQPFPRHDFGRWSNGRSACSYSLFPGLRIGRNKRFQIEEVIVSILNFASFFPSRCPLLFNLPICDSSQRIAYTKTSQKRQKLHGV